MLRYSNLMKDKESTIHAFTDIENLKTLCGIKITTEKIFWDHSSAVTCKDCFEIVNNSEQKHQDDTSPQREDNIQTNIFEFD